MTILRSSFNSFVVQIGIYFGFFQGLIWGLLSLIAIIWHLAATYDQEITYFDSYSYLLGSYMYYTFIMKDAPNTTMYIKPDTFFAVMFLYFFLSVLWVGISVYTYLGCRKQLQPNRILLALVIWASIACANLLLDVIFCSLLGADYDSVISAYNKATDITTRLAYTFSTTAYGIVMVLAARGFILWIINLVLTGFIISICVDLKWNKQSNEVESTVFSTIPRAGIPAGNLPEEARNFRVDDLPMRRRTEPGPSLSSQYDLLSTSSSFAPVSRNNLYIYDPEVERRLERYTMTPPRLKNN